MTAEQEVRFTGVGREIEGYLALPKGEGPFPALIVVQEIWGLVDHIKDVARRFANEGYVTLTPDLYTGEWREVMSPERIAAGGPSCAVLHKKFSATPPSWRAPSQRGHKKSATPSRCSPP